ncbi:nucleoside deaminase [Frondihabitans australicus]|uniref:tRNA(Arg) A34 adenosine deaminase TadA n=1 Tax=Frondihabitans australicus TaxID=386892 RepID=A0A495IFH1_9MICO|nr:nucleoside deaminase [Frondihabitans australicus]RKR74684.1 tRNA(Arg) A34 adenosine deaminase TadA [Frondihabitans australicus]
MTTGDASATDGTNSTSDEQPVASTAPTERDLEILRETIAVSTRSVEHGNHPFGAVLVDASGEIVLEAENTVVTGDDCTGHAETNVVRAAWQRFGGEALAAYSLYTTCEPCAMCSGAIYWSGIGRVVYAVAETELLAMTGDHDENPTMSLECRTVLNGGQRSIEVVGPVGGDVARDARAAHGDFWAR